MQIWKMIAVLIAMLLLSACSPDSDSREARMSLFKAVDPKPVYIAGDKAPLSRIKQEVQSFDELFDVAVIQNGKEILVAYKVKHMQRIHMEAIEKKITKMLKRDYPGNDFIVSSDMKIFLEAIELGVHVHKENYPKNKAKKWFGNIVELNEDTA